MTKTELPAFTVEITNELDYGDTISRTVRGTVSLGDVEIYSEETYLWSQDEVDRFNEDYFRASVITGFASALGTTLKMVRLL